jgi:uncharacterized protein YggE
MMAGLPLAAAAQPTPLRPTLTVAGQGSVARAPDQAVVSVDIVTNDDSAAVATSQNNAAYNALRTRLATLGLGDAALKTRSYNVRFVPKPDATSTFKPPVTGYVVTRSIDVTQNDVNAVGKTVDAAVAAGVAGVNGIAFTLRDRRALYAQALAAAMRDAEAQAGALADAAHMRLAGIRTISAAPSDISPQPLRQVSRMAAAPVPTEIQPSDVEVRASITVTYYLQP